MATMIVTGGTNGILAAETVGDTMQGPLTLTNQTAQPATPTGAAVLYASGGVMTYVNPQGLVNTIVGSQGGLTTTTTVANTATETLLQGLSLPANDAVASAVYRLRGWGVYSWTSTPTIQFTARLGGVAGTLLAQIPAFTLGTAQTSAPFEFEVVANFLSATTVQTLLSVSLTSATTSDAASPPFVATPTSATTISLSSTKVLQLDVTWGTAAAGNTISLLGGWTERIA
jgi:hypothetical protein